MSKHTPGPWAYKPTSGRDYGTTIYWVPDVCHCIGTEANARLIVAAPELLDALIRLLPMAEDDSFQYGGNPNLDSDIIFARAAIAKATGEKV